MNWDDSRQYFSFPIAEISQNFQWNDTMNSVLEMIIILSYASENDDFMTIFIYSNWMPNWTNKTQNCPAKMLLPLTLCVRNFRSKRFVCVMHNLSAQKLVLPAFYVCIEHRAQQHWKRFGAISVSWLYLCRAMVTAEYCAYSLFAIHFRLHL